MTTQEFSDNFDTLINNAIALIPFGYLNPIAFDEYEKSLFLTQAQELIILEYYSGKNPFGDAFEKSEEIRRYLTSLIKSKKCTTIDSTSLDNIDPPKNNYSKIFKLEASSTTLNIWFITYEALINTVNDVETVIPVIPVTQDDYHRTKNNPFRLPNNHRALRLDLDNNRVEIITNKNTGTFTYAVRYLTKPTPIVLVELPEELAIEGKTEVTDCSLNSVTHRMILERAVKLALASKNIGTNNNK